MDTDTKEMPMIGQRRIEKTWL